jgi:hypothetical protein
VDDRGFIVTGEDCGAGTCVIPPDKGSKLIPSQLPPKDAMPDRLQPRGAARMKPDRDVDRLLDEALAATFPASDPVAISVRGLAESGADTEAHDPARPLPRPAAGHH